MAEKEEFLAKLFANLKSGEKPRPRTARLTLNAIDSSKFKGEDERRKEDDRREEDDTAGAMKLMFNTISEEPLDSVDEAFVLEEKKEEERKQRLLQERAAGNRNAQRRMKLEQLRRENNRLENSTAAENAQSKMLEDDIFKERLKHKKILERRQEIAELIGNIKRASTVDACFLIDATGSMDGHIRGVRDKITNLVDDLKKKHLYLKLNLAMVAYRDHCDAGSSHGQFEVRDFTNSVEEFKEFVAGVEATGGGDGPEDVFGGFKKVTELGWSSPTKVLLHVTDAPCHGRRFHNLTRDDHEDGDPNGLTAEDLLPRLRELIDSYMFFKITNNTDKMISEFKKIMRRDDGWINVCPAASLDVFLDSISKTISSSISASEDLITSRRPGVDDRVAVDLVTEMPDDWNSIEEKEYKSYSFEIPQPAGNIKAHVLYVIRNDFKINTQKGLVRTAPRPFAHGAFKAAFYAKDRLDGEDEDRMSVIKSFLRKSSKNQVFQKLFCEMEVQAVAFYMARVFNKIKPNGVKELTYLQSELVRFIKGEETYSAKEPYMGGDYRKFNNNWGWVNEEDFSASMQAFSHWTYDITDGYLIVVDLQGIKNGTSVVLTDPVIHSKALTRFGEMNLAEEGVKLFFQTHACNQVCAAMGLKTYSQQPVGVLPPLSATVLL